MNQYDFFLVFWYFHAVLLLSFQGQGTHVHGQRRVLTLIICGAHNPHESNLGLRVINCFRFSTGDVDLF